VSRLILVRHAATSWTGHRYCGRSDPPLSPAGLAQASRLAACLAAEAGPITGIVTSPLRRARRTASIIAAALGRAELSVDDRWQETDFGRAEGLTFDEVEAAWPDLSARLAAGDLAIDWPGGESHLALAGRVSDALGDVRARDGTWLVVAHAGPLRHALAVLDPSSQTTATPGPGTAIHVTIGAAGLTLVERAGYASAP
jgi:broad specificity phosphatase PhoE